MNGPRAVVHTYTSNSIMAGKEVSRTVMYDQPNKNTVS